MSKKLFEIITFLVFQLFVNLAQAESLQHNWQDSPLIESKRGMVASQDVIASKVGAKILANGGNAIDAAVAVGYALAVTLPEAGNIGGGGFMMIFDAASQKTFALNYREKAPERAYRDMFLNKQGDVDFNKTRYSQLAVGIPGTVAGLDAAHQKFGKLTREQVMQDAITLAENGFIVYPDLEKRLAKYQDILRKSPEGVEVFFNEQGHPLKTGDLLKQPNLAHTLKAIAKTGPKAFYLGETAKAIVRYVQSNGGLFTLRDFANYKVTWQAPIEIPFKDYVIATMPPPSSGGVALAQLLEILDKMPLATWGVDDPKTIHTVVEAMNWVFADRSVHLGDPNFHDVPVAELLSEERISFIKKQITDKHVPAAQIKPAQFLPKESKQTTHYSVVDKDGNLVANTYTLNSAFGNGHVATSTGILLNNEMDDFSAKPGVANQFGVTGGKANEVAPHKQPLSSMTPTLILTKDKKPLLATGSPGGSRIITTVLHNILNIYVHKMTIAEAITQPRYHSQWLPDVIQVEVPFKKETQNALEKMGHKIKQVHQIGAEQTVQVKNKQFYGAFDPRRGGLAVGPS